MKDSHSHEIKLGGHVNVCCKVVGLLEPDESGHDILLQVCTDTGEQLEFRHKACCCECCDAHGKPVKASK